MIFDSTVHQFQIKIFNGFLGRVYSAPLLKIYVMFVAFFIHQSGIDSASIDTSSKAIY